ncbi:MAG: hydantoinase/oxoprolinase family protein [Henriciella sp.]|nr:hydantoinase/oxoprolinase family protein [Henriciella sp.]
MRIGIDVGGTHTDAVVLDGDQVVVAHKALTTADVATGIRNALAFLSDNGADMAAIDAVMIGTTQFTNAVIERRELSPVAAIRLGLPSGRGMVPKLGWPDDISTALGDRDYMIHGGYLYDGQKLSDVDDEEIDRVISDLKSRSVRTAAITSAFSPLNAEPEKYVAQRLRAAIPDMVVTLSHRIGRVGLLERENAALLNTALLAFADRVVRAFEDALLDFGIRCPVFISQNDGTLMAADFVREFPALTFSSGPTNSLRGAARLTGLEEAIVVDIGGTTSDIGVLKGGFPRESNMVVEVGGVRTNFRMPDIQAIGLGGGSLVSDNGKMIGPQSVGHRLVTEALIFGGETLTATDIVVAAGLADVGDASAVSDLPDDLIANGLATIRQILEDGIRSMKPNSDPLPVILVGGGAILAPQELSHASQIHTPEHSGVANAIGAAIAMIGGEAERFVNYTDTPRDAALANVTKAAESLAVAAGADHTSIRTTEIEETPIPYMDKGATRLRVKVVGEVAQLKGNGPET